MVKSILASTEVTTLFMGGCSLFQFILILCTLASILFLKKVKGHEVQWVRTER